MPFVHSHAGTGLSSPLTHVRSRQRIPLINRFAASWLAPDQWRFSHHQATSTATFFQRHCFRSIDPDLARGQMGNNLCNSPRQQPRHHCCGTAWGQTMSSSDCTFLAAVRSASMPHRSAAHAFVPASRRSDDVTYVRNGQNASILLSLASRIARRVRRPSTGTYSIRLVFPCAPPLHSFHKTFRRYQ